jgi:hypothetical protein
VLKICIESQAQRPKIAADFIVPYLVHSTEDLQWLLSAVKCGATTIPELVFADFGSRSQEEVVEVVTYLVQAFRDRLHPRRVELLCDCLIYGGVTYPAIFGNVKKPVVQKCWKMLESDKNVVGIDKIGQVCGVFLCLPSAKAGGFAIRKDQVKVFDDTLATYITGAVDGIADVLKLRLVSSPLP